MDGWRLDRGNHLNRWAVLHGFQWIRRNIVTLPTQALFDISIPIPVTSALRKRSRRNYGQVSVQRSVFCLHVKRLSRGLNDALFAFAHGLNPHVISVSKCQLLNRAGSASAMRRVFCIIAGCQVERLRPHSCHIRTDQSEFSLPHTATAQGCLAT